MEQFDLPPPERSDSSDSELAQSLLDVATADPDPESLPTAQPLERTESATNLGPPLAPPRERSGSFSSVGSLDESLLADLERDPRKRYHDPGAGASAYGSSRRRRMAGGSRKLKKYRLVRS